MTARALGYKQKVEDYVGFKLPDSLINAPHLTVDEWRTLSIKFEDNPVEAAMNRLPDELFRKWLEAVVREDTENINKLIRVFLSSDRTDRLNFFVKILSNHPQAQDKLNTSKLVQQAILSKYSWEILLRLLETVKFKVQPSWLKLAVQSGNLSHFVLIYRLAPKKDISQLTRDILQTGTPNMLAYLYQHHPETVGDLVVRPEVLWKECSQEMSSWVLSKISLKDYLLLASRSELDSDSFLLDYLVKSSYYSEAIARDILIPSYFANQDATKIGVGQFESFYECLGVDIVNYFQPQIVKSISPELLKKFEEIKSSQWIDILDRV